MSGGQQRQVTRWSYRLPSTEDEEDGVTDEQESDTRQALYQYVFRRADRDNQLSRVETAAFREAAVRLDDEGRPEMLESGVSSSRRLHRSRCLEDKFKA